MNRPVTILVCTNLRLTGASCGERGGLELLSLLQRKISEQQLPLQCAALPCFGRCEEGANVRLAPGGRFFHHTQPADVDHILQSAQEFAHELRNRS